MDTPARAPDERKLTKLGRAKNALGLVRLVTSLPEDAPKILCWVNTHRGNHETRAVAIRDTWGKRCDKLVFLSDVEDPNLPSIKVDAPATHEHLWIKHQATLRLIHKLYGKEFQWFYKADDDTFAFIENLKSYLSSHEIDKYGQSTPLLLGHRMTMQHWAMAKILREAHALGPVSRKFTNLTAQYIQRYPLTLYHYTPGGGGYAMNQEYLSRAVDLIEHNNCFNSDIIPDDFALSLCMDLTHQVKPRDTRDEWERERFHQYSPERVFHEPTTGKNAWWWQSDHIGTGFKNGTDCCSPSSIAFHYITPVNMYRIYSAFYE